MNDPSTIAIPVAALGPIFSFVHAFFERKKRAGLETRIDELEKKVETCETERTALERKLARRRRKPRAKG